MYCCVLLFYSRHMCTDAVGSAVAVADESRLLQRRRPAQVAAAPHGEGPAYLTCHVDIDR